MNANTPPNPTPPGRPHPVARVVGARDGELGGVLWSIAFFFFLLTAWYLMRPVRDEIGAAERDVLAQLYTGTFLASLVVIPLYAWLASGRSPRWFVPAAYRLIALSLVVFYVLMITLDGAGRSWVDRAFYVWSSVCNMLIVSIFWSVMADRFRREASKRLFGAIAVGGTLGGIAGSALASLLARPMGSAAMLLAGAVGLELACQCRRFIGRGATVAAPAEEAAGEDGDRVEGSVWTGLLTILRSPYLLWICAYLGFFTLTSTFLYFEQSDVIRSAFPVRDDRTVLLARMDLAVNTLTLIVQLFLTGRIVRWIGVRGGLVVLPLLTGAGFAALAAVQLGEGEAAASVQRLLAVLVVFMVVRRAANFAVARPVREMLFTIVSRDAKYKSKPFLDVVVYRGGDVASGWLFQTLHTPAVEPGLGFGFALGKISLLTVPIALGWTAVAAILGTLHLRLARDETAQARDED